MDHPDNHPEGCFVDRPRDVLTSESRLKFVNNDVIQMNSFEHFRNEIDFL